MPQAPRSLQRAGQKFKEKKMKPKSKPRPRQTPANARLAALSQDIKEAIKTIEVINQLIRE